MKCLIDGYNVMHAAGLMAGKLTPDTFRRLRARFLNELADALDPFELPLATVVFDASRPPEHLPSQQRHKGISVVFATADEDADTRIELILSKHPAPRSLTVVSSDRRVAQAATRRKATVMTADAFLLELAERRRRKKHARSAETTRRPAPERPESPDESERAFWRAAFADVDQDFTAERTAAAHSAMLTDAEIAEIAAEIERESRDDPPSPRPRRPGRP